MTRALLNTLEELRAHVTPSVVSNYAQGSTQLSRARALLGGVSRLRLTGPGQLHASVRGSRGDLYHVDLTLTSLTIEGECTCPVGYDCKHAVAVLLSLSSVPVPAPKPTPAPKPVPAQSVSRTRVVLRTLDTVSLGAHLVSRVQAGEDSKALSALTELEDRLGAEPDAVLGAVLATLKVSTPSDYYSSFRTALMAFVRKLSTTSHRRFQVCQVLLETLDASVPASALWSGLDAALGAELLDTLYQARRSAGDGRRRDVQRILEERARNNNNLLEEQRLGRTGGFGVPLVPALGWWQRGNLPQPCPWE